MRYSLLILALAIGLTVAYDDPDNFVNMSASHATTGRFGDDKLCKEYPMITVTNGTKKVIFHPYCRESWNSAQEHCKANGGRLWEPRSPDEFYGVIDLIGYNPEIDFPNWFIYYIHFWVGLLNPDGAGDSAFYASDSHQGHYNNPYALKYDATLGQDCVDIYSKYGGELHLGDHVCDDRLPFICEDNKGSPGPGSGSSCSCKYNDRRYECGTFIDTFPHCCTRIHCDVEGIVKVRTLYDHGSKRLTGCCPGRYPTSMPVKPGYVLASNRNQVCCKGEWIKMQIYGLERSLDQEQQEMEMMDREVEMEEKFEE